MREKGVLASTVAGRDPTNSIDFASAINKKKTLIL